MRDICLQEDFQPMKPNISKKLRNRGFALIATLSLMILLTLVAVGLLSLSAISLRSSSNEEANARAFANARLGVMMAIGELQKELGDDRRISADASIQTGAAQGHLVGAWNSWSPNLAAKPDGTTPSYGPEKTTNFRSWLLSSPTPSDLKKREWAATAANAQWPKLFTLNRDGFELKAPPVTTPRGTFSWAVSQENTKAKVNVAGPEQDTRVNVALQAQRRPSLALTAGLKQPADGWNLRAGRVLSAGQIGLDTSLTDNPNTLGSTRASFTVHSKGLLTDAVRGGLKTDLNLGFELDDSEFATDSWDGVPNPFRETGNNAGFTSPGSYKGQRALFKPLVENPIISKSQDYSDNRLRLIVENRFYAAGVPTFDHLRSFYRIPHHLYGGDTPVAATRGPDHVAVNIPAASGGSYFGPSNPPKGTESKLSIRPVLNRLVYLLSATLGSDNRAHIVITPIISLWNPHKTSIEIDGAVAYPWMDIPFNLDWTFTLASGTVGRPSVNMSMMMAKQFEAQAHGRSVEPYFLCEMTANGDGNTSTPIRFEPGEVRLFTPASQTPTLFVRTGSNVQRTVKMRAVEDISMMNTRGGLLVPMQNGVKTNGTPHGFTYVVKNTDRINLVLKPTIQGAYHYFVTLEDSSRIKNPSDSTRGETISEVQMLGFVSSVTQVASPTWSYSDLRTAAQPFAVIETFHRTAVENVGGQPIADLIYTTNPRHASINHLLAAGSFTVAPHFQSSIRSVSDFSGAVQSSIDGRRSFWGPSHSSTGKTHLPFIGIPREPMLSLAGFQHADFASSTYSAANQFANSWASPYIARSASSKLEKQHISTGVPIYDTCYLTNEALWDGFFFSGAAPDLKPATRGTPATAWQTPIAQVTRGLDQVIEDFVSDPEANPLANTRMRLIKGGMEDTALVKRLTEPAGCTRIAAHLALDGAFNINSTDVEAWTAQLSAMRGEPFQVTGGPAPATGVTAFPRSNHPSGKANDNWNGFRTLTDTQVRKLAENIASEVRKRGPFLSLAEFVNRRVEGGELGFSGAIQAAIEADKLNEQAKQATFSKDKYPNDAHENIINDTGVGIPGYLTQADVLQSLAPIITCRSDTFTIRAYGEAKDTAGKVIARAWCEAVVQRMPGFVDPADPAETSTASLKAMNKTFGRRFEVVSFRRVLPSEIQ
jgi:hypothetical protein